MVFAYEPDQPMRHDPEVQKMEQGGLLHWDYGEMPSSWNMRNSSWVYSFSFSG